MIRIITTIILFVCSALSAQSQYQAGMQKGLTLISEDKNAEASALFERIAAAEKSNWLPLYYVAYTNTNQALETKDKETVNALLNKAQAAQDAAVAISPDNAELLVSQARIHTAWIVFNPMGNGMKLSGTVNELYAKAKSLAPDNPRVALCKAEFEMGYARFFGDDTTPMCNEVAQALTLFANFKPKTPFDPSWGKSRAEATLKECSK